MSEYNLNSFVPVTAVAKKIVATKLVQETRKLFFYQLQNQKDSQEAFADYVIIIRTKAFNKLSTVEKEVHKVKLEDTCRKVLTSLNLAGLKFEARRGAEDLIFIFVLCPLKRLKEEVDRSRINDWLVGVRIRDDDDSSGSDPTLTDAERLRLVHDIIINSRQENGAGINPGLGDFELVESFLPLHDHRYNEDWIKTWSTKWVIDKDDLLLLRNHFGEKIAYYFAFLQYYCRWLVVPSVVGLLAYLFLENYSITLGLFIVLWSIVFTEFWRRREYELAVWWGVRNFSRVEKRRAGFREECKVVNHITGELVPYFPPWKRWLRRAIAAPIIIVFSLTLSLALLFYILFEVIMSEYYTGPFRSQLIYLPTIAYCALVPALNIVYIQIAKRLNEYENYETESSYEFNLTQKIFVANFLIGYLSIFFIGWIYIPFNEEIGYFFQSIFDLLGLSLTVKSVGPERLVTELKYFILTAQVISLFMEVVLPYLLRFGTSGMKKIKNKETKDGGKSEDESAFLKRVRREVKLPVYDVYEDYVEMISQYGYVSLFSVIWPLTPVFAFINNWIELRSDAIKLCEHTRRPIPSRADSIGPWLDNLSLLTWLSSITNPSIIYLYHPDTKGFTSSSGVIFTIVLVWFSEHILNVVRYIVQQMLGAFPSEADDLVQKEEYELKRRWLEKAGVSSVSPSDHELQEKKEEGSKWYRNEDLEETIRELLQESKEE